MHLTAYSIECMLPGMFEVIAAEEFESWYAALPEADAESVSSSIDVLAELGPALGPPRSSELLLWLDGTPPVKSVFGLDFVEGWLDRRGYEIRTPARSSPAASAENYWQLLSWMRRGLSLFESERFRSRVLALEPERATRALQGVERVRQMLGKLRFQLTFSAPVRSGAFDPIREAIDAVLSDAGLAIADPAIHASGLRELRVDLGNRCCRVLYGLDVDASRVLLILGEPLDRAYYGNTVRIAEKRWSEYLAGEYLKPTTTLREAHR